MEREKELSDFVQSVAGFDILSPRDKIRLFAWYIHTHQAQPTFGSEALRNCYKQLHIVPPNLSVYLPRMASGKPPDLLKERRGYRLQRIVRSKLDAKFGEHQSVVQIKKLLAELPTKVPDLSEKSFLVEAINCYRVEATVRLSS
jgi:hypothetical protein